MTLAKRVRGVGLAKTITSDNYQSQCLIKSRKYINFARTGNYSRLVARRPVFAGDPVKLSSLIRSCFWHAFGDSLDLRSTVCRINATRAITHCMAVKNIYV